MASSDIGKRVRRCRRALDMTQQQLALEAGLHVMTICRLERGVSRVMQTDTLCVLARVLGVSTDYLLGLVDASGLREDPR